MSSRAIATERAARGVYWARYTRKGKPILYAVDSKGDLVRSLVVSADATYPGINEDIACEWLWGYLERVDPRPQLTLMRGGAR